MTEGEALRRFALPRADREPRSARKIAMVQDHIDRAGMSRDRACAG